MREVIEGKAYRLELEKMRDLCTQPEDFLNELEDHPDYVSGLIALGEAVRVGGLSFPNRRIEWEAEPRVVRIKVGRRRLWDLANTCGIRECETGDELRFYYQDSGNTILKGVGVVTNSGEVWGIRMPRWLENKVSFFKAKAGDDWKKGIMGMQEVEQINREDFDEEASKKINELVGLVAGAAVSHLNRRLVLGTMLKLGLSTVFGVFFSRVVMNSMERNRDNTDSEINKQREGSVLVLRPVDWREKYGRELGARLNVLAEISRETRELLGKIKDRLAFHYSGQAGLEIMFPFAHMVHEMILELARNQWKGISWLSREAVMNYLEVGDQQKGFSFTDYNPEQIRVQVLPDGVDPNMEGKVLVERLLQAVVMKGRSRLEGATVHALGQQGEIPTLMRTELGGIDIGPGRLGEFLFNLISSLGPVALGFREVEGKGWLPLGYRMETVGSLMNGWLKILAGENSSFKSAIFNMNRDLYKAYLEGKIGGVIHCLAAGCAVAFILGEDGYWLRPGDIKEHPEVERLVRRQLALLVDGPGALDIDPRGMNDRELEKLRFRITEVYFGHLAMLLRKHELKGLLEEIKKAFNNDDLRRFYGRNGENFMDNHLTINGEGIDFAKHIGEISDSYGLAYYILLCIEHFIKLYGRTFWPDGRADLSWGE